MENHADRESCLYGQVGVRALSTRPTGSRSTPGLQGFVGEPDRERATPLEAGLVIRGVGSRLGAVHGFPPPPGCFHSTLTESGIPRLVIVLRILQARLTSTR